jgi:multidrug efflux system outer membrane protein
VQAPPGARSPVFLRLLYDSRRTAARPLPTLPSVGIGRSLRGFGVLAGLASASCAVGPSYERPELPAPAGFAEAPSAPPGDADAALAAWWERFEDPRLTALVERAAQSSLELRVAAARVAEARALRRVAGSEQLPALVVTGVADEGTGGTADTVFGALELLFEIDVWGRVRRSVEGARADEAAVEEDRRAVALAVVAEAATAYVEIRGLQHELDTVRQNLAAQRETLDLTEAQAFVGLASDLDARRVRALTANTAAEIPPLEADLAAAKYRLEVLLGLPPRALAAELDADAPIPSPPAELLVGLPADLLRRRPDVRRAERELAAETARIGAAQAELLPRLTLVGTIGIRSQDAAEIAGGHGFGSIGPSVEWPIFAGGRILANIAAQDARAEQAAARYERAVLGAYAEVETALARHAHEQVRRAELRSAVAAQRDAAELARRLQRAGLAPFLDVLDAERSLLISESRLAESETAVAASLVAVYAALGGGWERAEALALQ